MEKLRKKWDFGNNLEIRIVIGVLHTMSQPSKSLFIWEGGSEGGFDTFEYSFTGDKERRIAVPISSSFSFIESRVSIARHPCLGILSVDTLRMIRVRVRIVSLGKETMTWLCHWKMTGLSCKMFPSSNSRMVRKTYKRLGEQERSQKKWWKMREKNMGVEKQQEL